MYTINFFKIDQNLLFRKECSIVVNEKKYYGEILEEKKISSKYVHFKNLFYQKDEEEWNLLKNQDTFEEQLSKSYTLYNKREIDFIIFSEKVNSVIENTCEKKFLKILDNLDEIKLKYCIKDVLMNKNFLKRLILHKNPFKFINIHTLNAGQLYLTLYYFYCQYSFKSEYFLNEIDIKTFYEFILSKNYKCYKMFFLFSLIQKNVFKNIKLFLKFSKLSIVNGGSYNVFEEIIYYIAENMDTLDNVENSLLNIAKNEFFKAFYVLCLFYHSKKMFIELNKCIYSLKERGSIHINIILSYISLKNGNCDKKKNFKIFKYLKTAEKYHVKQSVIYFAFFYSKINNIEKAIDYYNKTQKDRDYIVDLYDHGVYFKTNKCFKLMEICFNHAIELGCDKSAYEMALHNMNDENQDISKMIYYFEKSFTLGNTKALYKLGLFYKKRELYDKMIFYFKKNEQFYSEYIPSRNICQNFDKYKPILMSMYEIGIYNYNNRKEHSFDYIYFSALKGLKKSLVFIMNLIKRNFDYKTGKKNYFWRDFKKYDSIFIFERLNFLKNNYFEDINYRYFILEFYIKNDFKNALTFLDLFFKKNKNVCFKAILERPILIDDILKRDMISNVCMNSDLFFKFKKYKD